MIVYYREIIAVCEFCEVTRLSITLPVEARRKADNNDPSEFPKLKIKSDKIDFFDRKCICIPSFLIDKLVIQQGLMTQKIFFGWLFSIGK